MKKAVLIILLCVFVIGLVLMVILAWYIPVSKKVSIRQQETTANNATAAGTVTAAHALTNSNLFYDTDLAKMSPLEFIDCLKKSPNGIVYVINAPDGWVTEKDAGELIKLVDSEEPCACVVSLLSSFIPQPGSTVGNEAMFILDGYKSGKYPPALYSKGKNTRDPKQYKEWWKKIKAEK